MTILNLFAAKAVHLELDQKFSLESGEESLPGAIVQEVVQDGDALECRVGCSFAAVHLGLGVVLALK